MPSCSLRVCWCCFLPQIVILSLPHCLPPTCRLRLPSVHWGWSPSPTPGWLCHSPEPLCVITAYIRTFMFSSLDSEFLCPVSVTPVHSLVPKHWTEVQCLAEGFPATSYAQPGSGIHRVLWGQREEALCHYLKPGGVKAAWKFSFSYSLLPGECTWVASLLIQRIIYIRFPVTLKVPLNYFMRSVNIPRAGAIFSYLSLVL